MKMPHIVRVEARAELFAELVEAVHSAGWRVGWLELGLEPSVPDALSGAGQIGMARAVVAGPGRTVSLKSRRGEPVFRDLVREHFLGCRLLLVRGPIDAPSLHPEEGRWRFVPQEGQEMTWGLDGLLRALRRPHLPGTEPTA